MMPETIRRLIIFVGVGAINTAIGLALILFLSEILHIHYLVANAIGYIAGLGLSFFLHRRITFRDVSHLGKPSTQFGLFATIFVFAYAVQFASLFVMVHILHWPNWFAQIAACCFYIAISFTGNRLLTFHTREKS